MTPLEYRLYFTTPCLSLRDIRLFLNLESHYGTREGFLSIVETQKQTFDNFPALYAVLKDFYGKETPKETAIQKATREEKILKGATFQEKQNAGKIKKTFEARFIQAGHSFPGDR